MFDQLVCFTPDAPTTLDSFDVLGLDAQVGHLEEEEQN